jgi:glyoxylase-like metal-dependent hydrolase (beta-lactamase superfamily II)
MKPVPFSWALCATAVISLSACAQTAPAAPPAAVPELSVARIECGTGTTYDVGPFSDTFSMEGLKIPFVFSCYLIRHGSDYLLWDTGHALTAGAVAPKVSIVEQLAQLQLKPEQIRFVGISHYHPDHTGQVASFPQATLLIGRGDWNVVSSPKPAGANPAFFTPWLSGGSQVEPVPLDKDVFGDGSVIMLATPGHTPGHHSLLVRLKHTGNLLISGDLAHFHENYEADGVPGFNTSRAESLASLERVKKMAAQLKATVILQHDARDVGKLPAFPAAAQ